MENKEALNIHYRVTIICESCEKPEGWSLYDKPNLTKDPQELNQILKDSMTKIWDCESCKGQQFTLENIRRFNTKEAVHKSILEDDEEA